MLVMLTGLVIMLFGDRLAERLMPLMKWHPPGRRSAMALNPAQFHDLNRGHKEARLTWSGDPAHIESVITPGH